MTGRRFGLNRLALSNGKRNKHLEGNCTECGGLLTYPAEQIGTVSKCPYCGQQTELTLAAPTVESGIPRKVIVLSLIAALILAGGLVGSMVALKRAQKWAADRNGTKSVVGHPPPPHHGFPPQSGVVQNGFRVWVNGLHRTRGDSPGYAVGVASNMLSRTRAKVELHFDLLDAAGAKVGVSMDTAAEVGQGRVWSFRAPVLSTNAVRVSLVSITEKQ